MIKIGSNSSQDHYGPDILYWIHFIIILCDGDAYINVNILSGDHVKISNRKVLLRNGQWNIEIILLLRADASSESIVKILNIHNQYKGPLIKILDDKEINNSFLCSCLSA